MQKEDTKKNEYDVAVIGGGPAGIMAAGQAARKGLRVVLLEKNTELAPKLLLTGGGRCNLSNAEFNLKELVKNYNNGEFLYHAFSVFGPKETVEFFEKLGVKTKIEKNKKVFAESGEAREVLDALKKYLADSKVEVLFNSQVADIKMKGNPPSPKASARQGKINKLILGGRQIEAKNYILCAGGKSYPSTGSTGLGYQLAEKLGHTIVKPLPALVPIKLKEEWAKSLQGVSLEDVKISVFQNGKKQLAEEGDFIFTHFGISGPAVLNISAKVGDLLQKGEVKICFDLFPLLNKEELLEGLQDLLVKYPRKSVKNILSEFVPEKLAEVLANVAGIDKNKTANNTSKPERELLVKTLKNLEVVAESTLSFEVAKLTRGGISLKEIDHKTMKSKIIDNLFFAGEIIDVDGKSGGFNLQMCWSTGYIAGQNCK